MSAAAIVVGRLRSAVSSNNMTRYAMQMVRNKGGGRPGGKPTFSWKERKQLRLQRKYDLKKYGPFAIFDENDDIDDEEEGADAVIDLMTCDDFEQPAISFDTSRKILQPSLMFGSHKTFGIIPRKKKEGPKYFRYARYLQEKASTSS